MISANSSFVFKNNNSIKRFTILNLIDEDDDDSNDNDDINNKYINYIKNNYDEIKNKSENNIQNKNKCCIIS